MIINVIWHIFWRVRNRCWLFCIDQQFCFIWGNTIIKQHDLNMLYLYPNKWCFAAYLHSVVADKSTTKSILPSRWHIRKENRTLFVFSHLFEMLLMRSINQFVSCYNLSTWFYCVPISLLSFRKTRIFRKCYIFQHSF